MDLMRMDTEDIADRRQLFELLTLIKDYATHAESSEQSQLIDEAITVWTKMMIADEKHDSIVARNVRGMQRDVHKYLLDLQDRLSRMHLSPDFARSPPSPKNMVRAFVPELDSPDSVHSHSPSPPPTKRNAARLLAVPLRAAAPTRAAPPPPAVEVRIDDAIAHPLAHH